MKTILINCKGNGRQCLPLCKKMIMYKYNLTVEDISISVEYPVVLLNT